MVYSRYYMVMKYQNNRVQHQTLGTELKDVQQIL